MIEPTQPINLGTEASPQIIHVAQSLSAEEKERFREFLKEKKIKFAWTCSNMPRLDTELIMHHLSIAPSVKPIKQKLRKMHPHLALLVKDELEKLLQFNFIRAIDYDE